MPGPIPKPDAQRRRRNAPAGGPADRLPAAPSTPMPAEDDWHPLARDWYVSLAESAQSAEYQASDWAVARVAAHELTRLLNSGRPSSQMFAEWSKLNTALLGTVGDRRRARLELTRGEPEAKPVRTSSRDRLKVV